MTETIADDINGENDEWDRLWIDRRDVLEAELGPADETILTSPIPIYLGGDADILMFRNSIDGIGYVTAGLIGSGDQVATDFGEYELMICLRDDDDWAPELLSRLAPYTFRAALNHGETIDVGPAMPEGSTIDAFLFVAFRQFQFREADAGLLLCIGITALELHHCQEHGYAEVLERLQSEGIYPYTDIKRPSVIS